LELSEDVGLAGGSELPLANSTDVPAEIQTEQQLVRSSLLVRVRWACCGLALSCLLLVGLDAGRAPPAAGLCVLAAVSCLNLTWTLLARRLRRASHASLLLLVQELMDGAAVCFSAAELDQPALMSLLLVPVAVARDDLGRAAAALVMLGGAAGLGLAAFVAGSWPEPPLQLTLASALVAAALLLWLKPARGRVPESDRQLAKATMLWQMAASLVSPLLNRAGLIRARADHIELVLPEHDVRAIAAAGRVIRQSADEIQQMLRPWREFSQSGRKSVNLEIALSEHLRKHGPTTHDEPGDGASELPSIRLETAHGEGETQAPWLVSEVGARSAILLLEALSCRAGADQVVHARLSRARRTVILNARLTTARPQGRGNGLKGWSRLMLRTSVVLAKQSGGSLILWRRPGQQRGADLKLPRLGW
jgi:hypothetical protein